VEDSHVLGSLLERHYRHVSYDSFTISSHDRCGGIESMQHIFQADGHTVDIKGLLLDFDKAR
jgi:hypothetical protein